MFAWADRENSLDRKLLIFTPPMATHPEKQASPLELAEKIPYELSNDDFLVSPLCLAADSRGDLFIYDRRFPAVFKLTVKNRKPFTVAKSGQVPGEFGVNAGGFTSRKLNVISGDRLLAADHVNRKIMIFNNSGKLMNEHPVLKYSCVQNAFYPLTDRNGLFYLPSDNGGAVDVFRENGKGAYDKIHTFLCSPDVDQVFGYAYIGWFSLKEIFPHSAIFRLKEDTLYYNVLPDNGF